MKSILASKAISKTDKLLLILSLLEQPISVQEICKHGSGLGLKEITKWNVSGLLKASGCAISTPGGWEILNEGMARISKHLPSNHSTRVVIKTSTNLLEKIKDKELLNYLEEALGCLQNKFYKSSIVMAWSGAIYLLKREVFIQGKLREFNLEADKRVKGWKHAKTEDEMGNLKERDILDILEKISLIGKNVKQELVTALELRNSCGHPNSLLVEEARAVAHLDQLILNVYSKYSGVK